MRQKMDHLRKGSDSMSMVVTAGSILNERKRTVINPAHTIHSSEGQHYKELEDKRKYDAMFTNIPGSVDVKSRFRTIADLFKNPPNPSYRIYGLLEDATTTVWFGDPGSLKIVFSYKSSHGFGSKKAICRT